jgi:hypothetical protein
MGILTLSDLIGETISSVRWTYKACNEYDLQEFFSYLKLSNGIIFNIPVFDHEEVFVLSEENKAYFQKCFESGKKLSGFAKEKIEGQKIEDLYFSYFHGELDEDQRAYIKLGNGYYITENNFGPPGLTNIDLMIFDEKDYINRIKSLPDGVTLKSYVKEIKKGG